MKSNGWPMRRASRSKAGHSVRLVAVVGLVACVHAALWVLNRGELAAPDVQGPLASASYTRLQGSADGGRVTATQIRADLKVLAPHTRAVRTYASTGGLELVPAIAREFGLEVSVGGWIGKDEQRNEREIRSAIQLARENPNVTRLIIGNETIFRREHTTDYLIRLIERVKRETPVPVTTAEQWPVWIDHPELASAVDCVFAHIIPYWEGFSDKIAVDQAFLIYAKLRATFPGKRIVIGEFGWPSAGYNIKKATPGGDEQATVLRNFVSRAQTVGADYNIVEAFDQPAKGFEGSVGPYWGMFDASLRPKFAWTGPIVDAGHWRTTAVAVIAGIILSLPLFILSSVTVGQAGLLAVSAHAIGAWCATVLTYWDNHYFTAGESVALGPGLALLALLVTMVLTRLEELAAVAFGPKPGRLLSSSVAAREGFAPKVSIHIPARREPAEMLKLTLDAVARLRYPNYECVVVVNNTPEPALWRPIEQHCRALGARFKFIYAERLDGFKAAALNLALAHMAADAEIIGVLDADYVVHPDWLKDLVPAFQDPSVGLVQAPQDHRDGNRGLVSAAMDAEYAGFFDVSMVQRNEVNAIIMHGTMCLIRRTALEAAGRWSSDTICEDTDLGLTILELGWRAQYTNRRYGWGLLPDNYDAFKKQRYRWACGGAQILKKHWRRFLPGASQLDRDQKREFLIGWLRWLGGESIGVAVAMLNLVWVPLVVLAGLAIPDTILTLPTIIAFALSLLHFSIVYRLRVAAPLRSMSGALFAAMSVQWTIARAVAHALTGRDQRQFHRTAKGGDRGGRTAFSASWEAALGGMLVVGATIVSVTNYDQIRENYFFAAALFVQSLPFLSAAAIAMLERSWIDRSRCWEGLEIRIPKPRAPRSSR
jgi:exo-beta-1,3-glucanase (GH17 family)/cellulose synthase/poly-beta-1,6-N-acetylglucosamine synthase-like glycosyltransferase